METVEPSFQLEAFNCPRCGALAHQHWENPFIWAHDLTIAGRGKTPRRFSDAPIIGEVRVQGDVLRMGEGREHGTEWSTSLCCSCYKFSVWRGREMVFPVHVALADPPHALMSSDARTLYVEASTVLPISRRAAAALARATMESELRHILSDQKSDLHTLIGQLSGQISTALWQSLTVLRDTGNRALHGGEEGVVGILIDGSDAELAPFLLSAVNQIVDEMVARPKRAEGLFNMLPAGVREAAERKRDEHSRGR